MTDRPIKVIIGMMASELPASRKRMQLLNQFPTLVHNYVDHLEGRLRKAGALNEAVAELLSFLRNDARQAEAMRREMLPIMKAAKISDKKSKERLQ